MKLYFDVNIEDGMEYKVTVKSNDFYKEMFFDFYSSQLSIDVDDDQKYYICIEQINTNLKFRDIIFAFLTLVIYGIVNIVFYNLENQWYQTFCPYKIKADITYIPSASEKNIIQFSCKTKKRQLNFKNIEIMSCFVKSNPEMTIQKVANMESLKKKFFYGIYKISSVYSVFCILMFIVLYKTIDISNFVLTNILVVLIICGLIVYIVGIYTKYKKYKIIRQLTQ